MRHSRKGTQHKQRPGSWKEGRPGQRGPEQSGDWWGLSGTEGKGVGSKGVGSKDRGALPMGGSIASWRAREEASASLEMRPREWQAPSGRPL